MDVERLETQDENFHALFIVKDTTPAFVNAIRRTILMDVPTIAIDEVAMIENTTPMFDEYIAHRLGFIPLWSDIPDLIRIEDCDCDMKGCNRCTVALSLTEETDKGNEKMVYSRDLNPLDHRVYPVSDDIPIMKVGPDQRLILEGIARFGTGREHAKWQPTGTLGYQYYPIIEIKGDLDEAVAESCPRGVLGYENDKVVVKDLLNCNLCQMCVNTTSTNGKITVKGDEHKILFNIKSHGSLYVDKIVIQASEILDDMADNFMLTLQEAVDTYEENVQI